MEYILTTSLGEVFPKLKMLVSLSVLEMKSVSVGMEDFADRTVAKVEHQFQVIRR